MQRIDKYLFENGWFSSREKAKVQIEKGNVKVDGKVVKPSFWVGEKSKIEIADQENFVSRGALKLQGALKAFSINIKERVCLDIGSSTGGFTEVCLKNGAKKVVACDVGNNVMDKELRGDARVELFENTDFRLFKIENVKAVDFIVSDVSFISLTKIFPVLCLLGLSTCEGVFLFKPQFECGKQIAKKFKGVIKDKKIHIKLLNDFIEFLKVLNIEICNLTYSSITGKGGNIEYLIHINSKKQHFNVEKVCESAFQNLK